MRDLRREVLEEFADAQRLARPTIDLDAFAVAFALRENAERRDRRVARELEMRPRGDEWVPGEPPRLVVVERVPDGRRLPARRSMNSVHRSTHPAACVACGRECASVRAASLCCR